MNKSQIENCVFRDSAITIDGSDDLSVKKNIYIGSERSGGMLDLKNIKKQLSKRILLFMKQEEKRVRGGSMSQEIL